ncbi:MAG: hypothetical protein EPN43_08660 [Jatrophihabitans sp.]|nr:MAG: hypothetical protein EPN43_08660 [Jatrophihabitans sp.]
MQLGLDEAACLLMAAGCHQEADPRMAMFALSAADHLQRAGAEIRPLALNDVRSAIADALRTLAALPDDVFAEDPVADAVDDAHEALAAVSG